MKSIALSLMKMKAQDLRITLITYFKFASGGISLLSGPGPENPAKMMKVHRFIATLLFLSLSFRNTENSFRNDFKKWQDTRMCMLRLSGGSPEFKYDNKDCRDLRIKSPEFRTAADLNDAGYELLQCGNFAQAEALFQAALRQDPKHAAALSNYGRLLVRRQQVPDKYSRDSGAH